MPALDRIPTRPSPSTCHVVVESPRGAALKLVYDEQLEQISLSRPLALGFVYPFDWGFIPSTHAPDGDPLDAMIFWDKSSYPGVVIPCRAIGVVELDQRNKRGGRERNDRVIAIPLDAERLNHVKDIADLSKRERDEIAQFFLSVVFFAQKDPKILGWRGAAKANALIDRLRK